MYVQRKSLVTALSLIQLICALPGRHGVAHQERHDKGGYLPRTRSHTTTKSSSVKAPATTRVGTIAAGFDHVVRAELGTTVNCDDWPNCSVLDVSTSLVTTFNGNDIGQTTGTGCLGPGCSNSASTSMLPTGSFSGTAPSAPLSSETGAPFGNATSATRPTAGPTGTAPISSASVSPVLSANGTDTTRPSAMPTGSISDTAPLSSNSTATGAPFANSTDTTQPIAGPTGTGPVSGTGISGEPTSTITISSTVTLSVTTYTDYSAWTAWTNGAGTGASSGISSPCTTGGPWSNQTSLRGSGGAVFATPSFVDSTFVSDDQTFTTQVAQTARSFVSTVTYAFSGITYTIPIPDSFHSTLPVTNHLASNTMPWQTAAPSSYVSDTSPSASVTSFEKCFTAVSRQTTGTATATDSSLVCWGFVCTDGVCADHEISYPLTVAAATTGGPYSNATNVAATATSDSGVYATESPQPEITESPWPSSPDSTRNPAAYTNTGSVNGSNFSPITSLGVSTPVDAQSTTSISFSTFTDSNGVTTSAPAATYTLFINSMDGITSTATVGSSGSASTAAPAGDVTSNAWTEWAEPMSSAYAVSTSVTGAHLDNGVMDSKARRAAVRAKRHVHGAPWDPNNQEVETDDEGRREERKFDSLLGKRAMDNEKMDAELDGRGDGKLCCDGFGDVRCWFNGGTAC